MRNVLIILGIIAVTTIVVAALPFITILGAIYLLFIMPKEMKEAKEKREYRKTLIAERNLQRREKNTQKDIRFTL